MTGRLWWVLLIFQSIEISQLQGRYVYFSTKMTWMNAWRKCHSCYDGQLAVLPNDINSTLTKYLSNRFWTGTYTEHSKWISIDGCVEKVEYKKRITLTKASVQACQKYCSSQNFKTFAISNHRCLCGIKTEEAKIKDTKCSIKCDDKAYCGGNDAYTLYESVDVLTENDPNELCSRFVCKRNTVVYYDSTCTNNNRWVLCANNTELNKSKWSNGMSKCLSTEAKYLMSVKSHSQCKNITTDRSYWNGIFRSKRSRNDTAYTSETKKLDPPEPVFLSTMKILSNGTKLERSYKQDDNKTFSSFCKTADVGVDIVDGTAGCPSTVMSSITTSSSPTTTRPLITTFHEPYTSTSILATSKASIFTSMDINSVTNSLPQDNVTTTPQLLPQKNNTSNSAAVIGGAVAGISIVVILLILIVIFLWRKRKKNELREKEINQSLHLSNQGYEAHSSDIPISSSQLNNNVENHEYIEVNPSNAVYSVITDQCNKGKYEECVPKHDFPTTEGLRNSHVYQTLQNHDYIDLKRSNGEGYFDMSEIDYHRNNKKKQFRTHCQV